MRYYQFGLIHSKKWLSDFSNSRKQVVFKKTHKKIYELNHLRYFYGYRSSWSWCYYCRSFLSSIFFIIKNLNDSVSKCLIVIWLQQFKIFLWIIAWPSEVSSYRSSSWSHNCTKLLQTPNKRLQHIFNYERKHPWKANFQMMCFWWTWGSSWTLGSRRNFKSKRFPVISNRVCFSFFEYSPKPSVILNKYVCNILIKIDKDPNINHKYNHFNIIKSETNNCPHNISRISQLRFPNINNSAFLVANQIIEILNFKLILVDLREQLSSFYFYLINSLTLIIRQRSSL